MLAAFRDTVGSPYTEVEREGACRRLVAEYGPCLEPCDGFCTRDGTCQVDGPRKEAGTLSFAGLTTPLVLEPQLAAYTFSNNERLTTPGQAVTVSADGGEVSAFTLSALPATPLTDVTFDNELAAGTSTTFSWTPADSPGERVRFWLRSDTASHGQFGLSVIECDVDDSLGALTLPQSMIDAHATPTNWGCGDCIGSTAHRYRRDTAVVDGVETAFLMMSRADLYWVYYGGG